MRPTALKLTAGILLFCGLSSAVKAQVQPLNVVTTAVPFLRISPDARSGGMGELGVATSPDAYSGLWNVGKVAFNNCNGGIGATYTPWLKDLVNDVYLASLSGYYKFSENQALTGSVRYFSLGNITFTDNLGNDFGSFRPREFGVDIGYSRKLNNKNGIGIALKYINSNLAGNTTVGSTTYKAGNAVAADLGWYHNGIGANGSGWNWGVVLSNLGSKISYTDNADAKDFIPANLGFGTNYTKKYNAQNKLSLGVELNKLLVPTPPADPASPQDLADYRSKSVIGSWFSSFGDAPDGFGEELKEFQASVGAEYTYNEQFSLRAGYFYENKEKGNRRYFTTGLGVNYNVFSFNFAYLIPTGSGVSRNPLSNTLRFSVLFNLGCPSGKTVQPAQPVPGPTPAPTPAKKSKAKDADKDSDGDGIMDKNDKCPTVPGIAKYQGCPVPDSDGDGVNDEEDRCPKTPGIRENRGCPDMTVYFKRDEFTLDPEDKAELDVIYRILSNNPDLSVTLEGHASTLGGTAHNQKLSEHRVDASKQYLVSKGIAASRISTNAFGEKFPVGDQNTEAGRAKSRRVHVRVNF